MSFRVQAPPTSSAHVAVNHAESKAQDDAKKAGRDFEAILVRQLLSQAKVAGKGGYGDMAIESLASSVTSAGGLGLGRAIEQALSRASSHIHPPAASIDPTVGEKK